MSPESIAASASVVRRRHARPAMDAHAPVVNVDGAVVRDGEDVLIARAAGESPGDPEEVAAVHTG